MKKKAGPAAPNASKGRSAGVGKVAPRQTRGVDRQAVGSRATLTPPDPKSVIRRLRAQLARALARIEQL